MSSFGMLLSDLLGVLFGAEPGETLTLRVLCTLYRDSYVVGQI